VCTGVPAESTKCVASWCSVQRLFIADWFWEQLRFNCVRSRDVDYTGGHSREKKLNSRGIVEPAQSHQYTVSLLVVDCGLFLAYLVSAKALIRWTGLCCIAAIH
jgi:hypothetical protein